MDEKELIEKLSVSHKKLQSEIHKVIVGQDDIVDSILAAILSGGHCLLVGVPGLAKTLLVKTISNILDLKFNRIQFTPDLMPSDITGTEILQFDSESNQRIFKFAKGPLFANIILADEINRTPPKTQSALLEAMQEYFVTVAGQSYELEKPFFVLATQNPIEQEGTYPLPEAQLDRFMFNIKISYPEYDEEIEIIKSTTGRFVPELDKVITREELLELQNIVKGVPVSDELVEKVVKLVRNSRPETSSLDIIKEKVSWGAGPRGAQFIIFSAKANAIINGRSYCNEDDIKKFIYLVLRHRIILNFNAIAENLDSDSIIEILVKEFLS